MRNVLSWLKGRVAHAPMKPRHQVTHEEARKQAAATLWRTDHPDPAAALADDFFAGKRGGLSLSRKLSKQQKNALREQLWEQEDEENRQAEDRPVDGINLDESPVWRLDSKEKIVVPKHYATTPDGDKKKRLIAEPTAATRRRGGPA